MCLAPFQLILALAKFVAQFLRLPPTSGVHFLGWTPRQTTYTLAPMPGGKLALSFSCPCKIGFSSNPLPFSFLHRPLPQPFGSPFKPRGGRLGVGKLQEPLCMLRYFFPSSSSTPLPSSFGVVRVGFLLLLLDHARCCSMWCYEPFYSLIACGVG